MAWTSRIGAWMFPATSPYNATPDISDGRIIYMLKPQYFMVTTSAAGTLTQMNAGTYAANGYSVANVALVKSKSVKQFVTVSCNSATDMDAICGNSTNRAAVTTQLVNFCQANQITGVELDWENFTVAGCTTGQYANFLIFLAQISTALHAAGFQLMVDGPSINNNAGVPVSDPGSNQASYRFKYEDMVPYCDYVLMQVYDDQFEYGAGTSIAPLAFITNCCNWMIAKVGLPKTVIGMPAYGYFGTTGGFSITEDNYNAFTLKTGFGTATRNADYEMNWVNAGTSYFYMDTSGMNSKRTLIESYGIQNISVWYVGGNQWFTGTEPSSPSTLTDIATITGAASITI